jgi:hypothetical protein
MPPKRKSKPVGSKEKPGKLSDAQLVEEHMKKLKHPLKKEIETIRTIVKKISKDIHERIKWNAPSYYIKTDKGEVDFLTFNHYKDKFVLLVFHHPAIVKIRSSMLEGEYKDRRLIYFDSKKTIETNKKELMRIITEVLPLINK